MKNRYKKIVFEAEEGVALEVSELACDILKIKAFNITNDVYDNFPVVSAGEYAEKLSVYIDKDGNKAAVLPGWTVSGISKESTIWGKEVSLVIYRIPKNKIIGINWDAPDELEFLKRTYDQLVWCPIKFLDADGTLDGESFSEKFGRRNYQGVEFSDDECHEKLEGELFEQSESVKKYGGFYFTRYNISRNSKGKAQSVKGAMPAVNVDFSTARSIAICAAIEENKAIKSHLLFGAEYDSILAWIIKSQSKTHIEVRQDSTEWGNHWNTKCSRKHIVETGTCREWCVNNIYDLAGNVDEWTQEANGGCCHIIRGGCYQNNGDDYPVDHRYWCSSIDEYENTGLRAAFCIK